MFESFRKAYDRRIIKASQRKFHRELPYVNDDAIKKIKHVLEERDSSKKVNHFKEKLEATEKEIRKRVFDKIKNGMDTMGTTSTHITSSTYTSTTSTDSTTSTEPPRIP